MIICINNDNNTLHNFTEIVFSEINLHLICLLWWYILDIMIMYIRRKINTLLEILKIHNYKPKNKVWETFLELLITYSLKINETILLTMQEMKLKYFNKRLCCSKTFKLVSFNTVKNIYLYIFQASQIFEQLYFNKWTCFVIYDMMF